MKEKQEKERYRIKNEDIREVEREDEREMMKKKEKLKNDEGRRGQGGVGRGGNR